MEAAEGGRFSHESRGLGDGYEGQRRVRVRGRTPGSGWLACSWCLSSVLEGVGVGDKDALPPAVVAGDLAVPSGPSGHRQLLSLITI